jgi:hypothetical protein
VIKPFFAQDADHRGAEGGQALGLGVDALLPDLERGRPAAADRDVDMQPVPDRLSGA